ncbi:MAG: HAD-IC family P-type ATPase [Solidesulfovibrio sp.]|uniref:cation-translocating P-type ATPase n=1 Tax=Solidesulfovibrio sp. TaxID=2910990 RepID=UPI002B20EB51|nr:HAD-IC family P-type ATPase [Solidesulfovibrio sp.]MEA4856411.1 HAD-IC family P-type ATPase [Solidesulfovibrio sp.]
MYRPDTPLSPFHAVPASAAAARLTVDPQRGLDGPGVAARRGAHGKNALSLPSGPGPLRRLAAQFLQPLVLILLAAGTASVFLGHLLDAGVIFAVVAVNAVLGYAQEAKAVSALAALSRSMVATAEVLRDGAFAVVAAEELVPGDVVRLRAGDRVPADMRLYAAKSLRIDESALTGESAPVDKSPEPVDERAPLADRTSMAHAATVVTGGVGLGIVTATGQAAEIGRIATLTATADTLATPLTRAIARFSTRLLVAILLLAGLCFAVGVARGEAPQAMFMAAVALAVGAIPEGLPAAVTVILAMGVSRMAARKAVIRRLPAVETLGSTTVVCSDKTGTLTRNRMTVVALLAAGRPWRLADGAFVPEAGGEADAAARRALAELLLGAALCNDAAPAGDGEGFLGDPTETALLAAAAAGGHDVGALRAAWPRLAEEPFDSATMFMATLHRAPGGGAPRLFLKGSAEAALSRCDLPSPGSPGAEAIRRAAEDLGRRGLRVLAVAARDLPPGTRSLAEGSLDARFTLLGLVAMIDPPRPEAVPAVAACRRAGIMVKMITGDQVATASAIAGELGLGEAAGIVALSGAELEATPDADLPALAARAQVFARVSPQQKLRLVRALQSLGHVTAMTGDGVNDAPALKQADIGVAMGHAGTEAAKEAADMVLADDNFATIAAAVEEGRGVFDNLVKFLAWTLPTNLGEGLVVLAAVLFGAPLPISPIQILWINMTTAGSLGLMLAFEPREPQVMDRPPRDPRRPILGPELLRRVVLMGLLLLGASFGLHEWELADGGSEVQARTVAVNVFVAMGAAYLVSCRSLSRPALSLPLSGNPYVLLGIGAALALQLAFTYAPPLGDVFEAAPIGPVAWLRVAGAAVAGFIIMETEKMLGRRA